MEEIKLADAVKDFDIFLKKVAIVEAINEEQLSLIVNSKGIFREFCQIFLLFQIENLLNIYFLLKIDFPSEFAGEKEKKLLNAIEKTEAILEQIQIPRLEKIQTPG